MDIKNLAKKLLMPPVWLIFLLGALSAAALVYIFVQGLEQTAAAYAAYIVSFYSLTVLCIFLSRVLPTAYRSVKDRICSHPVGSRYMTDAAFRANISLYISLLLNLLYAGTNVLFFVLDGSMWFVVLALYYGTLAVMRFLLVQYVRKNTVGNSRIYELKRAVLCSGILLTLNFALSGAVLMILYQNRGFDYPGVFIYVMAAYTFYVTGHAAANLVRYRKYRSPVMTVSKVIALSASLVSMLSLETAMLSRFGQEMSAHSHRLMVALTGAGVSASVIAMAAYMIVKCTLEIKKQGENNER